MTTPTYPPGLQTALEFPLIEALLGRRSRHFALGATLPDGPLAYHSQQEPVPLSELEQMLILLATAGNTGWHFLLTRNARDPGRIANYAAAAGGRTFPSAAGWHTTELFFTNDDGVYFFTTRDAPALVDPPEGQPLDLTVLLEVHRGRIHKLADGRMNLPSTYMDGHNTWCANVPGSLLLMPVSDLAQHFLAVLCFMVQNGGCIYNDIHNERIPGLEQFRHLVDVDHPAPLSEIEKNCLTMCTAELSTACYAGMLMQQALGLGGWLFTGMDAYAVLGCSGDPLVPGLGFRYDRDPRWPVPNPTGLEGVFTGYCPPHYANMQAAVEALVKRKFGLGGPFHAQTPGPWKDSAGVRSSAQVHNAEFCACVAHMAQYVYDRFGKFPGTVPSIYTRTFLQTHHLDLAYYDQHFLPGAYLRTHAEHMTKWHS
jgi:hypothetical protein